MAQEKESPKHSEKEEHKPKKKSALVEVEFADGRVVEVSREIAEAELSKPETADKIKEGDPVKLRNSAYIGAKIK